MGQEKRVKGKRERNGYMARNGTWGGGSRTGDAREWEKKKRQDFSPWPAENW